MQPDPNPLAAPALPACTLALPPGFRHGDILAFHRRDAGQIAEQATHASLRKGLLWHGLPACLEVDFHDDTACARLLVDGRIPDGGHAEFERMLHRMLGLAQDVEAFEEKHRLHAELGPLIARQSGLRVPAAATPFEAASWAITGQQISVAAALSLRRRLIEAAGVRHSSGLCCYPDADKVAGLSETTLRQAGFSAMKAGTLLRLAAAVAEGRLPMDDWARSPPVEIIREQLGALRGIGPWTVDYVLLRGFGWLDGSLHGDAAVRRGLQALTGAPAAPGENQAKAWLAQFSPWRALVGAHLWASLSAGAY